jgi:GT2 family glycosyltransferase
MLDQLSVIIPTLNSKVYLEESLSILETATREVLVIMNSDFYPNRPALEMIAQRLLEQPTLAAVGPMLNSTRQWGFGRLYRPNWYTLTKPMKTNILHGSCLMIHRDALYAVGGFDEWFFMYNEEYDWCWRVLKAGYSLEMIPETAVHFGGASTSTNPSIFFEGRRGGMFLIKKHFPNWITQPTRRFFQLESWIYGLFTKDPAYKQMWNQLEQQMKSGDYLSPAVPLSGRGQVVFKD